MRVELFGIAFWPSSAYRLAHRHRSLRYSCPSPPRRHVAIKGLPWLFQALKFSEGVWPALFRAKCKQ